MASIKLSCAYFVIKQKSKMAKETTRTKAVHQKQFS